jgi:hypothetical protein
MLDELDYEEGEMPPSAWLMLVAFALMLGCGLLASSFDKPDATIKQVIYVDGR